MTLSRSTSAPTGQALRITPNEVFFSGVEHVPQSTVITVKNVNTRVRIIRVNAPQTHHVTLHGLNPTTRLAPGLEFSFEVRYDGQLEGGATFRDKITVRTETENIEIPITSIPAKPDIRIVGDLDFGIIPHESSNKKEIRLVNKGEKEGDFKIKFDEGRPLKIKPKSGTVGAAGSGNEEVVVLADLGGQEIGSINGEATFKIDGQADLQRVVVAGTVMKHSVQVINEHGAETKGVDFGSLFFGERAEQSLQISNNGPKEIRCVISFGSKFDMAEMDEPQEEEKSVTSSEDSEHQAMDPFAGFIQTARMKAKARESGENPFTIFPLTAIVEPFSSKSLKIRFTPAGHNPTKGFTSNMDAMGKHGKVYEYVGQVDFGIGGEKCRFPLRGRGIESGVIIRPNFLQFGDVPTSGHAEHMIDLSNKKSDLPVKFAIPNLPPYFRCKPSQGLIPPGQSVALIVGYWPKSFGRHQRSIPIEIHSLSGKLVRTLKLRAQGTALTLGAKRSLIGGTDKLPEDFETEPNFIDDEQAISSLKMRQFRRPKLWEGKENAQLFEDIGDGTKDALGLEDHKMQLRHKDRYTDFIRKERKAKENFHLTRKESEDEVNLGMDPRSGLKSPQLKLPNNTEPLWTNPTEKSNEPKSMKALPDEQAALVHFHKDRPDTDDEKRLCGMALSSSDVAKLVMGPPIVDFGRVSASSNNTQYFFVQNTLMQPIHIVLDIKSIQEFRYTRHTSQVIPAGGVAKFPIVLFSKEVMVVNQKVEFVINGCQFRSFEVEGQVVAVSMDLSADEFMFQFDLENWEPFVDQLLLMDNPNPFSATYEWDCFDETFSVSPQSGTVPPHSSTQTKIRWTPKEDQQPGPHESTMSLVLQGGSDNHKKVRLRAELSEASLQFSTHSMDVGPIPCGVPQTIIVHVKNTGAHDAAFRVVGNDRLRCTPSKGKVAPEEVFEVEVAFACSEPGSFHTELELELRNQQHISLPISAQALVPQVLAKQDIFDFGQVYTGGSSRLAVNLTNATPVPALLMVDLSSQPNFELLLPKDNWSPTEYEECPLKRATRDSDAFSVCSTRCSKRIPSTVLSSIPDEDRLIRKEGYKYQIKLNPSGSLELMLLFRPTEELAYDFPITMVITTNTSAAGAPINVPVAAEGLKSRLLFSRTRIDFGTQIVQRSQQIKVPYSADVRVSNNDDLAIKLKLPENEQENAVFTIHPSELSLEAGETKTVAVQFSPSCAEFYEQTVPISLDGEETPSMELQILGMGQYPRLRFDRREVILPAVPLDMRSEAKFHVVNDGFDNLELRYRLPADDLHVPLSIDFPEGSLIGIAKERLPVIVSFQAPQSMSFTANIDFLDEEGNRYSILVTGTADNSILTIEPFLEVNKEELVWSTDPSGAIIVENDDYVLPDDDIAEVSPAPLRYLVHYLNATTTKGPFTNLQAEIHQSRGRLLYDLVEHLGGKKTQNRISTLSGNKKEAAEQLLGHFDWMLTHLKSHGALLNTVKPEMLLETEDFQRIMLGRATKASNLEDEDAIDLWKIVENNFEVFSKEAWNTLFLQITKIYLFSRVTLKAVRDICNLEQLPQINQKALVGSNIYSVAESILLAWLTENLQKGLPDCAFRVTNFDTDLRSGVVFFALLVNHWPALVRYGHNLVKKPIKDTQFKTNAELIVRMVQDINLPFPIREQEIMSPIASEMSIFILYLFQTLPELIPRIVVDFTGRLGEHQVKTIEINNPSKKALVYSARLEGHADFKLDTSVVKINPKSTFELTVSCTPTIAIPQESRLVLLSRRDGGAHASTLVFNLRSLVNCRAPLKQIKTEMALYDFQRFEFTVNNPFPADCEFSIRLRHEPALPIEVPSSPEPEKTAKRSGQKNSAASRAKREPSVSSGLEGSPYGEKVFSDSFGVDKSRLRIKHNGSDKLKGSFLPFITGTHYCTVIFEDKEFGEFCYELVGEVTLPAVFSEHRFTVGTDGSQVLDIYVPYVNHQLESARRVFQDKHPLGKDKEQLALLKASREDKYGEMNFQVNQSNSLITTTNTLLLKHNPQTQGGEVQGGLKRGASGIINASGLVESGKAEQPNTIRISLKPIGTGIYPSRIILTAPYDVRVVDVEISAQKLGETFQLEFTSPAFQTVCQDIPLVNNSEKAMVVQASCTGLHFQGPREVTVPSGITGAYPLKFVAPWIGVYTGTLELSISTTGEKNIYHLQGQSEEPLAEGHIVFECQARTSAVKRINVPNTSPKGVEYKIFSDIAFLSGRESIKVESNSHANYKVTISPPRSGVFHGTLNFETDKGFYVWFSMEVRASEPPEVGIIEVSTRVREAVAVEISVSNPLPKNVQFSASYSEESLIGPRVLDLDAEETGVFKFYYAPLKAGDDNGSVSLVSEEVGEFWYQLEMHADEAAPVPVPLFNAEAGKIDRKTITFDNPLDREVSVIASCSNPQNFRAQPEKFSVGPYGSESVHIHYEPSSIGEQQKATITLQSSDAGRWEYECLGKGMKPGLFPQTQLRTTLGSSGSSLVTWKNPFPEPATVDIDLKEHNADVLEILLRKTKNVTVAGLSSLQIPVGFAPSTLDHYEGILTVSGSFHRHGNLQWGYPLSAMAEIEAEGTVYRFKCRARSETTEEFKVQLEGLGEVTGEEEYHHEIIFPEEHKSLENSVVVSAIATKPTSASDRLTYSLHFSPNKMFTAEVQFVVHKSTGGRWRFTLHLQATAPVSECEIVLEAQMNQSVTIPVVLYSATDKPERFSATFTSDTPLQFDVKPEKGFLPLRPECGAPEPPAPFEIVYTCKELGKVLRGTLFIQTKDAQYSYNVRGRQPGYMPPAKSSLASRIDNKLSQRLEASLGKGKKMNYILANIKHSHKLGR